MRNVHHHDPKLPAGSNFCQCSACGAYFLSVAAFDRHRYGPHGDRACTATPQLPDAGFERDPRGYWRLPKRQFNADVGVDETEAA